jgi:hypothetical protein
MKVLLLYEVLLGDLVRYPIAPKRVIAVAAACFRNCFRSVRVVLGSHSGTYPAGCGWTRLSDANSAVAAAVAT